MTLKRASRELAMVACRHRRPHAWTGQMQALHVAFARAQAVASKLVVQATTASGQASAHRQRPGATFVAFGVGSLNTA